MEANLIERYQTELHKAQEQVKTVKNKINSIVLTRVLLFIATITGCYLLSNHTPIVILTAIIGSLAFVYLVQIHANLSRKKQKQAPIWLFQNYS